MGGHPNFISDRSIFRVQAMTLSFSGECIVFKIISKDDLDSIMSIESNCLDRLIRRLKSRELSIEHSCFPADHIIEEVSVLKSAHDNVQW